MADLATLTTQDATAVGVESTAGMTIAAAAAAVSQMRLEGTKAIIGSVGATLLPPGSELASMKAMTQQREAITKYLDVMGKGAQQLGNLSKTTTDYTRNVEDLADVSARSVDATDVG